MIFWPHLIRNNALGLSTWEKPFPKVRVPAVLHQAKGHEICTDDYESMQDLLPKLKT